MSKGNRFFWLGSVALVVLVYALIFIGALVTSWNAGMAVPDWPLSFGSLNPSGWWGNFGVRLEHGHRLFAAGVGLAVGIFVAALWANWFALAVAAGVSVAASTLGRAMGVEAAVMANLGIWPAAVAFLLVLVGRRTERLGAGAGVERRLAIAAFVLVCVQASLGGLRVTRETAGMVGVATVLRVLHGCTAQAFLVCVVSLMALLGARCREGGESVLEGSGKELYGLRVWGWAAVAVIYVQLILGATMRHLGAGLAISSFPSTGPAGSWWPESHGLAVDLNFAHTRLWAVVCSGVVLALGFRLCFGRLVPFPLRMVGSLILTVLGIQVALGISVIWNLRPPLLASVHVVTGALLLGCSAWVAARVSVYAPAGTGLGGGES
jgi:cytochrome c oxidase assembly protein subunit 15